MKLVKESLFEKFEKDSDPIKDMGIGVYPPGTIVKKIYETRWKSNVSSAFWEIGEFTQKPATNKGIILEREFREDKIKLWIAFFGDENRIYNEIMPNIHKGLDFFIGNYAIQHGEFPLDVWKKNLKIVNKKGE